MTSVLIFTVLCVLATTIAPGLSVPSVTYYNNDQIAASTFNFQTTVDRPELVATWKYLPSSNDRRICKVGIWAFYWGVENYELGSFYSTEVFYDACDIHVSDAYPGSVRFVGEIGKTRLNLYSGTQFTKNGTYYETSQPNIPENFVSAILVGYSSVQFYLQNDYAGQSYCLQTNNLYASFHIGQIGAQPGDIKSIRFGCTSDAVQVRNSDVHHTIKTTVQKN